MTELSSGDEAIAILVKDPESFAQLLVSAGLLQLPPQEIYLQII